MERPKLKLIVQEQSEGRANRRNSSEALIGREIEIREQILELFCFRALSPREYDLLILAGAVAYSDRRCKRRRSGGWARDLHLSLPMHSPKFWKGPDVYRALCDSLVFLTGDNWNFDFRSRKKPAGFLKRKRVLPLAPARPIVLPSSHGLDSFANSLLLKKEFSNLEIVRVVTKNTSMGVSPNLRPILELQLPVYVRTKGGESSYRTRSFLFYAIAGIASAMLKARSTSIPENGQGSFGPSLVVDGNEWPYRGSHPGFTLKLGRLLTLVTDAPVSFEHPRIWKTKGEVIDSLVKANLHIGWDRTRSCPRDQRDIRYSGPKIQCGICGGCLLRRLALRAAGLEGSEHYYWDDLSHHQMDESLIAGARRVTNQNDIDIFLSNALAMRRLADMSRVGETNPRLKQLAYEISEATERDIKSVMHDLKHLLDRHAQEWMDFVNGLPEESWFRRMCFV